MSLSRKTPLRKSPFQKKPMKKKVGLDGLLESGLVSKANTFTHKPRKKLKARSGENKGWWSTALDIWDNREHVCEVCSLSLGDYPNPSFFSHLLPRGAYRLFKNRRDNIRLVCAKCHQDWHDKGPERLRLIDRWMPMCRLYYSLRDEANKVNT